LAYSRLCTGSGTPVLSHQGPRHTNLLQRLISCACHLQPWLPDRDVQADAGSATTTFCRHRGSNFGAAAADIVQSVTAHLVGQETTAIVSNCQLQAIVVTLHL